MIDYTPFLLYVGFVATASAALVVFFLRHTLARQGVIHRSLNLELLAVRLRQETQAAEEKSIQQIREKIALMEQVYVNFHALREGWWSEWRHGRVAFALEMTVPHVGEAEPVVGMLAHLVQRRTIGPPGKPGHERRPIDLPGPCGRAGVGW